MNLSLRKHPSLLAGRTAGAERGGSVPMGKFIIFF